MAAVCCLMRICHYCGWYAPYCYHTSVIVVSLPPHKFVHYCYYQLYGVKKYEFEVASSGCCLYLSWNMQLDGQASLPYVRTPPPKLEPRFIQVVTWNMSTVVSYLTCDFCQQEMSVCNMLHQGGSISTLPITVDNSVMMTQGLTEQS